MRLQGEYYVDKLNGRLYVWMPNSNGSIGHSDIVYASMINNCISWVFYSYIQNVVFIQLLDEDSPSLEWLNITKSVLWNYAIIQVLPFLNNPRDEDPSYKTDLDFFGLFCKEKPQSYKRRITIAMYAQISRMFHHSFTKANNVCDFLLLFWATKPFKKGLFLKKGGGGRRVCLPESKQS